MESLEFLNKVQIPNNISKMIEEYYIKTGLKKSNLENAFFYFNLLNDDEKNLFLEKISKK